MSHRFLRTYSGGIFKTGTHMNNGLLYRGIDNLFLSLLFFFLFLFKVTFITDFTGSALARMSNVVYIYIKDELLNCGIEKHVHFSYSSF